MIDTIKSLAHQVAEDYLTIGTKPNDSISAMHEAGEIENEEVMKRVCEIANQNIYLSIFNDKSSDKTNIKFDLADYSVIQKKIQQSENAMQDYMTAPKDFRTESDILEDVVAAPQSNEKLASLNICLEHRNRMAQFVSKMEMLKEASAIEATDRFNQMARDAKIMVANGESIGDLSKLACIAVMNADLSFVKVARAYDMIHKDLVSHGFTVRTDFTKTSSLKPNPNSEVLAPAREFAIAVEKVAAFGEMLTNSKRDLETMDKLVAHVRK